MTDFKERQQDILNRYTTMYNSGILSPTTKSILEDAVCLLAEVLDEEEYEYGTQWRLSEEAHGPDKTVVYPENSREDAIETLTEDSEVAGETGWRGNLVRRRKAGPWEEALDN